MLPTLLKDATDVRLSELDLRLLHQESTQVLAKASAAGLDLPVVGVARRPVRAQCYEGEKTDWVLVPEHLDPTAAGGMPLPRDVRQRVTDILAAGIEVDALLVAHEVPTKSLPVGVPLGANDLAKVVTVPPPVAAVQRSAAIGSTIERVANAVGKGAVVTGKAAAYTAGGLALAAGALALAPLALLDPVLIGGRSLRRSPTADDPFVWFELARWDW